MTLGARGRGLKVCTCLCAQGRFGLNGSGVAECPRCRGTFVEMLTEHERRRIQVASPLRQVLRSAMGEELPQHNATTLTPCFPP